MRKCVICEHAKIEAIDAALTSGRLLAVVATQFRAKKADLLNHLQHAKTQASASAHPFPFELFDPPPSLNPFSQFKQAWQLAKDDRPLQQAMVAWLNEQLQAEEMEV